MALNVCGEVYLILAWEQRSHGWAADVTPTGWVGFENYLDRAKTVLEMAVEAQPEAFRTYLLQMDVALGSGDRKLNQVAFSKAVRLNPTSQSPYNYQLNFLRPRWHGSEDVLLAFGRKSVLSKASLQRVGVRSLLGAHTNVAAALHSRARRPTDDYFKVNAKAWQEVRGVFADYFEEFPDDHLLRCQFIKLSFQIWDLETAKLHVEKLGDNLVRSVISPLIMDSHRSTCELPPGSYHTKEQQSPKISVTPKAKATQSAVTTSDEQSEARPNARQVVSVFAAARDTGAAGLEHVQTGFDACKIITSGVSGSGDFSTTKFQVTGLSDVDVMYAIEYIAWNGTEIVYVPGSGG